MAQIITKNILPIKADASTAASNIFTKILISAVENIVDSNYHPKFSELSKN